MRRTLLGLIVALAAVAAAVAEDTENGQLVDAPQFVYERSRKGPQGQLNWVRGHLTIEAARGVELDDVSAHVDYVDYAGKTLISAGPKAIGRMKGGEVRETELSQFSVPIFSGYVITVRCTWQGRERGFTFYGSRTATEPFYIPRKPYPRTVQPVIMAHELDPADRGSRACLYVRVRNLGAVTTKKLHATIQLLDRNGKPRRGRNMKGRTLLSGAPGGRKGEVAGGEERLFAVRFGAFPRFESYSVKLDWETPPPEELVSGGEFQGGREVELAHFRFRREGEEKAKGRIEITGKARNGLSTDIQDLKITLALYLKPETGGESGRGRPRLVKAIEGGLPGVVKAGEVKGFKITADGVGRYNDFAYEIAYSEPGGTTIAGAPGGQPVVTVKSAVMKGGKTLVIEGDIRNATSISIRDFRLTFHLVRTTGGREETVAEVVCKVPGVMRPGESVPFSVSKDDCPAFDLYRFETYFLPAR